MPVSVQSNSLNLSPSAAHALLAVGGGKQTESSRHSPVDLHAADGRGEFLAMVLHELQNYLGNILDGVTFVRESEGLIPEPKWLWTGMENAGRQVQSLLADLIDLCEATHPTFRLRRRPIDLSVAAHAAAERRRSAFEREEIRLTVQLGAEPVWVTADSDRLELVLDNLLDNAAKYTEPGGRVTVSVEAASAEVVLRVRDTGVGIAPEVLPFVFEPFVREDAPGVRPRRGSGLGLLLVRTLVELHGGRVQASSAGRGRGSEFVVRFPAHNLP